MKHILESFISKQFLHFLIAGGIAAAVNFGVGYTLAGYLPWHGDIVVGYVAGMATAFFLFEQKVFGEHPESRQRSVLFFVAVNALGLLQTWVIYAALMQWIFPRVTWLFFPAEIARAIAIITPTLTSYIGHKYFTFAVQDGK